MKIIQLMTSLYPKDAIGEEALMIHSIAGKRCNTCIMALDVDPSLKHLTAEMDFSSVEEDDILILHKASGDDFVSLFQRLQCKKVLLYHNITPPSFFLHYDLIRVWNQWRGRTQLKPLVRAAGWVWGDSQFNCDELIALGSNPQKTEVLPLCLPFETQPPEANQELIARLNAHQQTKIFFIGRVAPNKKFEDIIKAFYYYQKTVDPSASLYLVGSYQGYAKYYAKLIGFIDELGLRNVFITGQVSQEDKWAYYSCADMMLCMSEHEGFCVPLLEAMYFNIPILAYASTAVTETMGDAGVLFTEKDYAAISGQMKRLMSDPEFRGQVIDKQRQNLLRFIPSQFEARIQQLLQNVIAEST